MRVVVAPAWPRAVFHVLAHIDVGSVAASCFDPSYVAWAAAQVGPADLRDLGADRAVLAAALSAHDVSAAAQAIAFAWETNDDLARVRDRALSEIGDDEARSTVALRTAKSAGAAAEVLRAAAELELTVVARLREPTDDDRAAVTDALAEAARACPELSAHVVGLVPALARRGRVLGEEILVGAPGVADVNASRVAWQAAHEATVWRVARELGRASPHADVERAAIVRLRSRARSAGLAAAHGRWLAGLDLRALGAIPDEDDVTE